MTATEACGPAALHVRLRRLEPAMILHLIDEELVMHMTGAFVVISMPIETSESDKRQVENMVELTIATARALRPTTQTARRGTQDKSRYTTPKPRTFVVICQIIEEFY